MKVKALKSIKNQYYTLKEGEEYDVYAIVYFATPFFSNLPPVEVDKDELRYFVNPMYSYGVTRNELVYIIKNRTITGRSTLVRYNTANFAIVDSTIPDNWSTSVIDLVEEVSKVRSLFEQHGNNDASNFIKPLEELRSYKAKIIVSGEEKFHSFEYLHSICDDNVDDD